MGFRARLLDAAARDLARLDRPEARRIVQRIDWLASNFGTVKREALSGDLAGFYKLRVGDFRVIYETLDAEQVLLVHAIGHRREIYRKR
ncbi:type II toxin-antitoxin system RelE/ParE family toxin [candidate division WOR-3 bacterium]|nr:type II toxin-antitoxin system RelE/ParE family toxin [candidate division WOR-3 bacterium]